MIISNTYRLSCNITNISANMKSARIADNVHIIDIITNTPNEHLYFLQYKFINNNNKIYTDITQLVLIS